SPRPCVALDNYEASAPLAQWLQGRPPTPSLLIGPERGWSATERDHFRAANIPLAHLGTRVLRTDTAALAALTLASQI
ncbi:MAG: RsmE family RNA methyltransferase, partial [Verrucomicrobiota bacterium]